MIRIAGRWSTTGQPAPDADSGGCVTMREPAASDGLGDVVTGANGRAGAAPPDLDDASWVMAGVDTSMAHPARRYDYWVGGKDNFAADRASGDAVEAIFPTIRLSAIENRRFLGRAVEYLAGEAHLRQFLDIGTGIPAADNTHEVAQRVDPSARVVYVDNDPVVLAHARALLSSRPQGRTEYIEADLRDPAGILGSSAMASTIDLSVPVALMLVAVLHFIPDEDDPYGLVATLVDALPSGSHLTMTHATYDYMPEEIHAEADVRATTRAGWRARSRQEFTRFFDGLELVEPGVVVASEWRAQSAPTPRPSPADVSVYAAVGRKP
jgi:S-adenosyl methyltransferase